MKRPEMNSVVEQLKTSLFKLSDFIHDHPEPGNQEHLAHEAITDFLAKNGFEVERELLGLPTAFRATCNILGGGPKIGLMCEYDAIDIGHGHGHNIQAPSVCGAAIALARCSDVPATIVIYGTPAEETASSKVPMTKAGIFDELDIALMMQPGDCTMVDEKTLALNLINFFFEGKAAHAAAAPEKGISALDAVLMMFNGMEYLREHVRSDVRFHGIITDGGKAANLVPEKASAQFYVRANDRPHLDTVVERVYDVARGAALATGAKLTIQEVKAYDNKINIECLNRLLLENAREAGAKNFSPQKKVASADFSSVTYRVPAACLRVAFIPQDTASHSMAWVDAAKSEAGYDAILVGAKALAGSCYQLISTPELLQEIKQEFELALEKNIKI
jgi:amidohydrolase